MTASFIYIFNLHQTLKYITSKSSLNDTALQFKGKKSPQIQE